MSGKHRWTYQEDFDACLHYLWCVFEYSGDDTLTDIVNMLAEEMPHISYGSLRMKIQNIKAIALDVGLEDRFTFSPLSNYSVQCKRAFNDATDALGILKEKYDGGRLGTVSREELMENAWLEITELKLRGEESILLSDDNDAFMIGEEIAREARKAFKDKNEFEAARLKRTRKH